MGPTSSSVLKLICTIFVVTNLAETTRARISAKSIKELSLLANNDLLQAYRNMERSFNNFLGKHGKNYTGAEYLRRLKVFETNVFTAIETQLIDPTAVHGITQFFDLTEDEFAHTYLGLKMPDSMLGHPDAPPLPVDNLPPSFDWREKGAVTPVKNQGACGSCYAFSTIGAVEGAHFLKTGELVSLSEQQIVDCDHSCDPTYHDVCDSGCQGGLMNNAVNYIMKAGGIQLQKDYPYTGKAGRCKFDTTKDKVAASVEGYKVVSKDEKQMAANLVKYGPLAIAINANWMQSYVKGVSCPLFCNKKGLDHGVLVVGYGEADYSIARLKKKPYWIIKNSWGTKWGEGGFYRVCSGVDMCGLEDMVTLVLATDVTAKNKGEEDVVQEE